MDIKKLQIELAIKPQVSKNGKELLRLYFHFSLVWHVVIYKPFSPRMANRACRIRVVM